MRLRLAYERGGHQSRVCVWDGEENGDGGDGGGGSGEWVPLNQALARAVTFTGDPEVEEAVSSESVLPFLGPDAQPLR